MNFLNKFLKKKILLIDTTEKCYTTSTKKFLSDNLAKNTYFDLDYGLPPGIFIQDNSIKIDLYFDGKFKSDNYYDVFNDYLIKRSSKFINEIDNFNVQCIFGWGIFHTTLIDDLNKLGFDIYILKLFREPFRRLHSEYNYVKYNNQKHHLNNLVMECQNFIDYIKHEKRKRNLYHYSLNIQHYSNLDKKKFKEICFIPSNNYNFFLEKIIEFCNIKKNVNIPHLNKFKEIKLHYESEEKIFKKLDYKDCDLYELVLDGSY